MHRGIRDSKKIIFLQQRKTHPSKAKKLSLQQGGGSTYLVALLSDAIRQSIAPAW